MVSLDRSLSEAAGCREEGGCAAAIRDRRIWFGELESIVSEWFDRNDMLMYPPDLDCVRKAGRLASLA